MTELDLANGPVCPRCGCTDTEIRKKPSQERSWYAAGSARCRYCGQRFHFTVPAETQAPPLEIQEPPVNSTRQNKREPIYFRPVQCPKCNSKATKVARKMPTKEGIPTVRYHKCKECGHSFKSVEAVSTP